MDNPYGETTRHYEPAVGEILKRYFDTIKRIDANAVKRNVVWKSLDDLDGYDCHSTSDDATDAAGYVNPYIPTSSQPRWRDELKLPIEPITDLPARQWKDRIATGARTTAVANSEGPKLTIDTIRVAYDKLKQRNNNE